MDRITQPLLARAQHLAGRPARRPPADGRPGQPHPLQTELLAVACRVIAHTRAQWQRDAGKLTPCAPGLSACCCHH